MDQPDFAGKQPDGALDSGNRGPYFAVMTAEKSRGTRRGSSAAGTAAQWAGWKPALHSFAQRAKATLGQVQFSSGVRVGPVLLSRRLSRQQRQALEFWIRRLPAAFQNRLPQLKLAVADQLNLVRGSVFINESPLLQKERPWEHPHAVSFIPERTVVLEAALFRRRVELGRILYHEFCHFVWPRLGNPKRRRFEALLQQEFRERVRGELGYSSEYRKLNLSAKKVSRTSPSSRRRRKLDYVCESFCDTGSFVLLGSERRKYHSEYTLSHAARERRSRAWSEVVMEAG